MAAESITRSSFAQLMNVNKSTVTRWAKDGRLVLDERGNVLVDASRARLAETSGGRDDVAARHAQNRGADIPMAGQGAENAPEAAKVGAGGTADQPIRNEARADAQARKESAAADLLEIELALKRGSLYPQQVVDAVFSELCAIVRARLSAGPDQIAPIVAPVTDMDEVHALESEHHRTMLQGMVDDLQRAKNSLRQRDENVG